MNSDRIATEKTARPHASSLVVCIIYWFCRTLKSSSTPVKAWCFFSCSRPGADRQTPRPYCDRHHGHDIIVFKNHYDTSHDPTGIDPSRRRVYDIHDNRTMTLIMVRVTVTGKFVAFTPARDHDDVKNLAYQYDSMSLWYHILYHVRSVFKLIIDSESTSIMIILPCQWRVRWCIISIMVSM